VQPDPSNTSAAPSHKQARRPRPKVATVTTV
jgi:hypothetical protein